MKILVIAVGTRGDIEPFLAIAELLDKKGHEILCCFPEQFRQITLDSNFKFIGLSRKFLDLLDSEDGKIAMGGKASIWRKIQAYYQLYKKSGEANKILAKEQFDIIRAEKPDKIVYHIKSNYPLIWEAERPNSTVLVSPIPYMIHSVHEHSHIGFKFNFGTAINTLTYKLANYGLIKTVQGVAKELYNKNVVTTKKIKQALYKGKMIYSVSPLLFEQPNYWSENVKVMGYHERNKTRNWMPDKELEKFISAHKNIVFITFGSMVNAEPEVKTNIIINVLERLKIPAIINTGEGGLLKPEKFNSDLLYFVSNIPYEWLLPQVSFMIHHGGSGTTHMSIKYGCPSLIIPHIIDQFLWNDINYEKGLGPKGVSISNLSEKNLESLLIDLTATKSYKTKAIQMSKSLQTENFEEELINTIIV